MLEFSLNWKHPAVPPLTTAQAVTKLCFDADLVLLGAEESKTTDTTRWVQLSGASDPVLPFAKVYITLDKAEQKAQICGSEDNVVLALSAISQLEDSVMRSAMGYVDRCDGGGDRRDILRLIISELRLSPRLESIICMEEVNSLPVPVLKILLTWLRWCNGKEDSDNASSFGDSRAVPVEGAERKMSIKDGSDNAVNSAEAPNCSYNVTDSVATSSVAPPDPLPSSAEVPNATFKRLRPIIIDGLNVGYAHSQDKYFSARGLAICAQYFKNRGHNDVTIYLPFRIVHKRSPEFRDMDIVQQLISIGVLRIIQERQILNDNLAKMRIGQHYDIHLTEIAHHTGGILVTRNNLIDCCQINPEWLPTVRDRKLNFEFHNDVFIPWVFPLGEYGPPLEEFLRFPEGHQHPSWQTNDALIASLASQPPSLKTSHSQPAMSKIQVQLPAQHPAQQDFATHPQSGTVQLKSGFPPTTTFDCPKSATVHEPVVWDPQSVFDLDNNQDVKPSFSKSNKSKFAEYEPAKVLYEELPEAAMEYLKRQRQAVLQATSAAAAMPQHQLQSQPDRAAVSEQDGARSTEQTEELRMMLKGVFPQNDQQVEYVLAQYDDSRDVNFLASCISDLIVTPVVAGINASEVGKPVGGQSKHMGIGRGRACSRF